MPTTAARPARSRAKPKLARTQAVQKLKPDSDLTEIPPGRAQRVGSDAHSQTVIAEGPINAGAAVAYTARQSSELDIDDVHRASERASEDRDFIARKEAQANSLAHATKALLPENLKVRRAIEHLVDGMTGAVSELANKCYGMSLSTLGLRSQVAQGKMQGKALEDMATRWCEHMERELDHLRDLRVALKLPKAHPVMKLLERRRTAVQATLGALLVEPEL